MKDAKGHGSNKRPIIPGHPYHARSTDELQFISKDAAEAARAMRHWNSAAESKYLDQMNDAQTVLGYRQRGGKSDRHWDNAGAADQLHSGTPKSDAAPVHDSMNSYENRHDEDTRLGAKYGFNRPTKGGSGI